MTPKSVKLVQGVWCDGRRWPDGSHTEGHVLAKGSPYVIFDGAQIACPAHAEARGITIEWPDEREQTASAGALA